ncbi:MAG: glycosyltransferase family 9 protein [Candidatus Zixiibacteriota bacterium]|nr:MAG: glycosyltransferase family 9 protein [candidate division Zixibacteria bacterium]
MQKEIDRILIIRLSSLGDVILTAPVIAALKAKFPHSELFFLTKARYADLLRNDPRISSLVEFDPRGKHRGLSGFASLISELRSYDFDLLVDLHANLRSFLVRRLVKSRIKLKYNKRWLRRWLMVHLRFLKTKALRTVHSYLEPLQKLEVELPQPSPLIFLSRDDLGFSNHFLLERQVKKDDIVVGVHPGAKWETKRWDEEKFARVCQSLVEKSDCKIVLLGDAGEAKLVEEVGRNIPTDQLIKAINLPLGGVMALIKRCDCLITNDSGPMHIASALGVPVVAIFGPTHPKLGFAPVGSENVVLCADVKCSPCGLHGEKRCSKKSRFCMDLIESEMVIEAAEKLLQENKSVSKET